MAAAGGFRSAHAVVEEMNDPQYLLWVKVVRATLLAHDGLRNFVLSHADQFHKQIVSPACPSAHGTFSGDRCSNAGCAATDFTPAGECGGIPICSKHKKPINRAKQVCLDGPCTVCGGEFKGAHSCPTRFCVVCNIKMKEVDGKFACQCGCEKFYRCKNTDRGACDHPKDLIRCDGHIEPVCKPCADLLKELASHHATPGTRLSVNNSPDPARWKADAWAALRLFIRGDGYKDRNTFADTDLAGVLKIMRFCKTAFHGDIKDLDQLGRCTELRNVTLHDAKMVVSQDEADKRFNELAALLENGSLKNDPNAEEAVRRIRALQARSLSVRDRDEEREVLSARLTSIVQNMEKMPDQMKAALESTKAVLHLNENVDLLVKLVGDLTLAMKAAGAQRQAELQAVYNKVEAVQDDLKHVDEGVKAVFNKVEAGQEDLKDGLSEVVERFESGQSKVEAGLQNLAELVQRQEARAVESSGKRGDDKEIEAQFAELDTFRAGVRAYGWIFTILNSEQIRSRFFADPSYRHRCCDAFRGTLARAGVMITEETLARAVVQQLTTQEAFDAWASSVAEVARRSAGFVAASWIAGVMRDEAPPHGRVFVNAMALLQCFPAYARDFAAQDAAHLTEQHVPEVRLTPTEQVIDAVITFITAYLNR